MKKLKMNLTVVALLLGSGIAVAAHAHQNANVKWGRLSNGTWQLADANDQCNGPTGICTREYPEGQNPNEDESGYENEVAGAFIVVP